MKVNGIHTTVMLALMMGSAFTAEARKPNVVFFALDDMNDWVGAMGYEQVITPNMDRLAKSGVAFQNAHTAGIFCAPSRSAIFTGRHASTTGCYTTQVYFHTRPEITPLQKVLQEGGYATYGAGKLFHHPAGFVDLRGWDEFYVRSQKQKDSGWPLDTFQQEDEALIPQPFPNHSVYKRSEGNPTGQSAKWFLEWGKVPNEKEHLMADTIRTEWAAALLKKKHEKPFFVGVGLYSPHFPNFCPAKYFDLYDRDKLVPPPYKDGDLDDLPPAVRKAKTGRGRIHQHLEEIDAVKDAIHGYLACVSYADAMLGRLLDALEEGPNAKNTIVVLWSDHGYHHGEKMDWGKHTLWERTSNVPFMWAGPGIAKGADVNATVSLMDIFPTLTELCSVTDKQPRDGTSLVPVLKNPAKAKDRDILLPGMKPEEYAIINEEWRYIRYADGTEELYNVKQDPNEWNNLAGNPELEKVKEKLIAAAPETFAVPGETGLKLVIKGDEFEWKSKKKPQVKALPKSVRGAEMVPRKNSDEAIMSSAQVKGRSAWTSEVSDGKPTYFYFKLNDAACRNGKQPKVQVSVTYLDRGNTAVMVQYDSTDEHATANARFKEAAGFKVKGTDKWMTEVFNINDARFSGGSNGGDLRIGFAGPDAEPVIAKVIVKPRK